MDLRGLNLGQICRTCKCVSPQMRSLFEGYENPHVSPRIDEMLMVCASVQVMCGDGLPSQICQVCVEKLKNAFVFKRQCEEIDASLREYINNVKVIEIKEEPQNSEFIGIGYDGSKYNESSKEKETNENSVSEEMEIKAEVKEEKVNVEDEYADNNEGDTVHHDKKSNVDEVVIGASDSGNSENKDNDSREERGASESLKSEVIEEKLKEEKVLVNFKDEDDIFADKNEDFDDSTNNADSKYQLMRSISPKAKRGPGRPKKNPNSPPKVKVPGRGRGRPVMNEEENEHGEFPCPACQAVCTTVTQLDRHVGRKHEGLKIHKCNECDKEYSKFYLLKRHVASHSSDKPFPCTVCTKSFRRRDHLNQHQKLHDMQHDYECDICQEPFNRADHLARHKASQHGIGEKVMDEKKYECPQCHKNFMTEKSRDLHVKAHSVQREYVCDVCERAYLYKPQLTEHLKSHNENSKKFLCSECGQRFTRKDFLLIHMRRHRGEKPFKCKHCEKGFTRSTDLTVHERYHTGEKTCFCVNCGKGFGRLSELTVHMRTHTGEKPYQCTYCDAAFAQNNDLKAHVRRHTGERFQCDLCTRSFLARHLVRRHKRKVHGYRAEDGSSVPSQINASS